MTKACIYSAGGKIIYQYGNSRTVCAKGSIPIFETRLAGQWVLGRNRHAIATIARVKSSVAN